MTKYLIQSAIFLSFFVAVPALCSEDSLLIVAADFDAALGIEAPATVESATAVEPGRAPSGTAVSVERESDRELKNLIRLLRSKREEMEQLGSKSTLYKDRDRRPTQNPA